MKDQQVIRYVCEIMEQYGRVSELKRTLKKVKSDLDALGDPKPDYFCTMYPDEHGPDYEYYEQRGAKERLEATFSNLLREKISQEKLLKRLKYQFSEYQIENIDFADHIDINYQIQVMVEDRTRREKENQKFISKCGKLLGELALNIISVQYNNRIRYKISKDIRDYASELESTFRRAQNSYSVAFSKTSYSRFKMAKYMITDYIKDDQDIIDIIYMGMNISKQLETSLSDIEDDHDRERVKDFMDNINRLNVQYNILCTLKRTEMV